MNGLVEQLHENEGVQGWAVDPSEPDALLEVELWAGTLCLARTQTGLERPDVCASIGLSCRPGFRFGNEAAKAVQDAAARGHLGDLNVRVHGASRLESLCPPRTLEMIRSASFPADHAGDALQASLKRLSAQAAPLTDEVEASRAASRIGYLEGIWTSRSGLSWLIGWMIEDAVLDRPVIIVDTARYPAGIAFSLATRADLAPDAKAFVAVMQSDWRADVDLPPQIVMADGSGRYLESVRPAPASDPEAVLPIVRDTLRRASGPHCAAMLQLLAANRRPAADRRATDRVQVDEVAVLPGFGAFVNGWALSPSKQAQRFVLKAGDHAIRADERSQARFRRTDLTTLFPHVEQALQTAGFVILCRGPIDDAALNRLGLEVEWHDGTSTIVDVPSAAVRVLGLTSQVESICRFYPAVEAERFFPDLAYHAARLAQTQASRVEAYQCNPARASLLLAVPKQPADISLLFDQAERYAAALPDGWGLAIIASPDEHRGRVLTLFAELQRASERPCSLFFTHGAAVTSDVIEEVAVALSSERIAWIAGHVLLTPAGWQNVGREEDSLALFAVGDPAGGTPPAPGLDAFSADLAQWRRLRAAALPQIGGIRLPLNSRPFPVVADAAVLLGPAGASPFTLTINEAVHRAFG